MKLKNILPVSIALSICIVSCQKKEGCTDTRALNYDQDAEKFDNSCEYGPIYSVPETYSFENVKYSGQTARLQLLKALSDKIGEASNTNALSEQELIDIFENSNSLFGSTKNLSGKVYDIDLQMFYDWFAELSALTNNATGQEIDDRYYNADGVEIKQMVEKGLMGAVFYYQAASNYLEGISSADNIIVEDGEGTSMEHNFDEAFGYFGIPIDFKTNNESEGDFTTTSWYWGKYCIGRDAQLGNRNTIFDAFLTCRAAISENDYSTRDNQITIIRNNWELINAANVVHYINKVNGDISSGNLGDKYHHWSEGKAFVMCFKYNIGKKISDADLTRVDNAFGANPGVVKTTSDFDSALQILKDTYGFTDSQMLNL